MTLQLQGTYTNSEAEHQVKFMGQICQNTLQKFVSSY